MKWEVCLVSICLWTSTISAQTELFNHFEIYAGSGGMKPVGNVSTIIDPGAAFGWMIRTPYYLKFHAHAQMTYSLLRVYTDTDSSGSIHYIKSGIGLEYFFTHPLIPAPGMGMGHYLVRSRTRGSGRELLLDYNESEFGWYPTLRWRWHGPGRLLFSLAAEVDIIFSQPKYTWVPGAYAAVGWNWW